MFDAPGPRFRRRVFWVSVVSAFVLAGLVALGLRQFASGGERVGSVAHIAPDGACRFDGNLPETAESRDQGVGNSDLKAFIRRFRRDRFEGKNGD